jgi:hypothetical protein
MASVNAHLGVMWRVKAIASNSCGRYTVRGACGGRVASCVTLSRSALRRAARRSACFEQHAVGHAAGV